MIMDGDEEEDDMQVNHGGGALDGMQIDFSQYPKPASMNESSSSSSSLVFRMEDFDPYLVEEQKNRADRITGAAAKQARNDRLFNPPTSLAAGGYRPQSPSEAELDVVQQALQADYDEVRDLFEWALEQLPTYGSINSVAMAQLLRMKPSSPCLALCRAGFLIILANSRIVRREASSGYVANRIYHRIPEQNIHQFFESKIVNEARRQYIISADGTGTTKDVRAARSVLFVNRVRNMVAQGGVEGFMLAMNVSQ